MIGTTILSKVGEITNSSLVLLGLISFVLYFIRFSIIFLILHIWFVFRSAKIQCSIFEFFMPNWHFYHNRKIIKSLKTSKNIQYENQCKNFRDQL